MTTNSDGIPVVESDSLPVMFEKLRFLLEYGNIREAIRVVNLIQYNTPIVTIDFHHEKRLIETTLMRSYVTRTPAPEVTIVLGGATYRIECANVVNVEVEGI